MSGLNCNINRIHQFPKLSFPLALFLTGTQIPPLSDMIHFQCPSDTIRSSFVLNVFICVFVHHSATAFRVQNLDFTKRKIQLMCLKIQFLSKRVIRVQADTVLPRTFHTAGSFPYGPPTCFSLAFAFIS